MSKRILFVDEEFFVRKALERSFRTMRDAWHMRFAASPREALGNLDDAPADIIVTETVFSERDGIEFLRTVRDRHPECARIVLSGYADRNVILKSVDLAHQYLAKPCEDDALKATITRALIIKDLLDSAALKRVVSKIDSLPSLPALYVELVQELQSEDGAIAKIGDIIARDMGLAAKVLKLVNSAFFGLPRQVTSPGKAVNLLGIDLVKAIVLMSGTFDQFRRLNGTGFCLEDLWQHAVSSASCAKIIAHQAGLSHRDADAAFMSGLLHDIGKLLIAAYLPNDHGQICRLAERHDIPEVKAEWVILGTTHAAVGAYLLGLWGLPEAIIHAVAFHHDPGKSPCASRQAAATAHLSSAIAKAALLQQSDMQDIDDALIETSGLLVDVADCRRRCESCL